MKERLTILMDAPGYAIFEQSTHLVIEKLCKLSGDKMIVAATTKTLAERVSKNFEYRSANPAKILDYVDEILPQILSTLYPSQYIIKKPL